jgi:hypothetical protein
MKKELILTLIAVLCGIAVGLLFNGCTSTGEFDAAGFTSATRAVSDTYTTLDRSRNPQNIQAK